METSGQGSFRILIKIFRSWNQLRDWFASSLEADNDRKTTLYIDLSRSATLKDLVYWLQILFSAGIATLGLVQNSSAVIIGAMLISPLMAPILSAGLALATGDLTLGVRAVANLFLSSLLGIGFAYILVKLLPYNDQTTEIKARIAPNTIDLVIALFSGAIGAIATCRETKGVVTSIPGVAIAVALMPPLCVVGYGFGLGGDDGWKIARGGGLLYLTNLVAITFTAMLVFVLLRIDRKKVRDAVRLWRDNDSESKWWLGLINRIPRLEKAREVRSFTLRLLMILIPLLIIYVPLSQSFAELRVKFQKQQMQNSIRLTAQEFWDDAVAKRPYSDLDELRVNESGDKLEIYIRAFSNTDFTTEERENYINRMAGFLNRKPETISLQVIMIPTADRAAGKPLVAPTATPVSIAELNANFLQRYKQALGGFQITPPAELIDYNVATKSSGAISLTMYYLSTRDIEEDGRFALQNSARRLLNLPTLTLSLSRVSAEPMRIPFKSDEAELDSESEAMSDLAANLQAHQSLKVRFMIAAGGNGELPQARKKALQDFLGRYGDFAQERLVFGELEDPGAANTFQLFLR